MGMNKISHAKYGCNLVNSIVDVGDTGECIQSSFDWYWIAPNYKPFAVPTSRRNDIALLRMRNYFSSALDFSLQVGTICLPTQTFPDSETLTALGWGETDEQSTPSELLKEV